MKTKQILVVDDDPLIRNLIQTLLSTEGYTLDEVGDGLQAVAQMKTTTYDLILSDIQMPHLDGIGVLKEAHRLQPTTRVILMSGMDADPAKILAWSAFDFIPKPFELKSFLKKVERGLSASQPAVRELITGG